MFAVLYLKLRKKNEDIVLPFNNFKSRLFQHPSGHRKFLLQYCGGFQYSFIHSTNIHCRINSALDVAHFPSHMHFEVSPEYLAFMDPVSLSRRKAA